MPPKPLQFGQSSQPQTNGFFNDIKKNLVEPLFVPISEAVPKVPALQTQASQMQSQIREKITQPLGQIAQNTGKSLYDTTMKVLNPGQTYLEPSLKKMGVSAPVAFGLGLAADLVSPGPGELERAPKIFKGLKDLSTKLLEKFKGMPESISEQQFNEVLNRTRKEGLKAVDEQIVKDSLVLENGKINLTKTAKNVETHLVPLTPTPVKAPRYSHIGQDFIGDGKYGEIVYESPIKTSAGDIHFPGMDAGESKFQNYFSHVRFEDLPDGKTRKILETQSDLMQKENFAKEGYEKYGRGSKDILDRQQELSKLNPYSSNDPLAQLRTFREEVKRAAKDGKDTLLIPSGETAMKIEGLSQQNLWRQVTSLGDESIHSLKPEDLKVGSEVADHNADRWIITAVLGDGKFKAVPKRLSGTAESMNKYIEAGDFSKVENFKESFDISGKVDQQHFVYKLNESAIPKEARKMGLIVEGKVKEGNGDWWKITIPKEAAKQPVTAFGKVPLFVPVVGAAATGGVAASQLPLNTSTYTQSKDSHTKEQAEIEDFKQRIVRNETGNKSTEESYSFRKSSGKPELGDDLGRYQITEGELKSYSQRFLGATTTPEQFMSSPRLQDRYVENKYKYYKKQGYSDSEIAWIHRNGLTKAYEPGDKRFQEHPYVKAFNGPFTQIKKKENGTR